MHQVVPRWTPAAACLVLWSAPFHAAWANFPAECSAGSPFVPPQPPTDAICTGLLPNYNNASCGPASLVRSIICGSLPGLPNCCRYECVIEYKTGSAPNCGTAQIGGACISGWPGATCSCPGGSTRQPDFSCKCNPGLREGPPGPGAPYGSCIGCMGNADCNSGDYCSGPQTCVGGVCVAGPPPNCDDQKRCTVDRCDRNLNRCVNALDLNACLCQPPLVTKVPVTLDRTSYKVEVACPPFVKQGGNLAVGVQWGVTEMATMPDCDQGCVATDTLSSDYELVVDTCKRGKGKKITVKDVHKTQGCLSCDFGSCKQQCGAPVCVDDTLGGSISVGQTLFFGVGKNSGSDKTWGVQWRCGTTLEGGVTTGLDYTETKKGGSCSTVSCTPCERLTATIAGEAGGKLGCEIRTVGPQATSGSGGEAVGYARLYEAGGAVGKWGDCGNESCPHLKVDVEAGVRLKAKLKLRWFSVAAECNGKFAGCSEANPCGQCSCKGCRDTRSESFSCSVTPGVSP